MCKQCDQLKKEIDRARFELPEELADIPLHEAVAALVCGEKQAENERDEYRRSLKNELSFTGIMIETTLNDIKKERIAIDSENLRNRLERRLASIRALLEEKCCDNCGTSTSIGPEYFRNCGEKLYCVHCIELFSSSGWKLPGKPTPITQSEKKACVMAAISGHGRTAKVTCDAGHIGVACNSCLDGDVPSTCPDGGFFWTKGDIV